MKIRWRWGIAAAIILLICGMYPQLKLWYVRGDEWQGNYAYNDIDEVAYTSYVSALIDGRPRKSDPYTGHNDSPETPQKESLFSIQFASPMLIATFARATGISAPTATWIFGGLAAFFSALILFWLIAAISKDSIFAMSGTLVVLCGGALAAGEGAIGEILGSGIAYPYFPFLRRYVPSTPFPFFLAFCLVIWMLASDEGKSRRWILSLLAIAFFAFTVYSYFYIWTTALAFLFVFILCYLTFRPEGWRKNAKHLVAVGLGSGLMLIPYAYLLSNRSHTLDEVQLLVQSHSPDLLRFPELISYGVLCLLGVGLRLGIFRLPEPQTVFAFALALVPIVVFNQQVITGKSLQPIHYQVFIGNYVAAMALVVAIALFRHKFAQYAPKAFNGLALAIGFIAAVWGFVECHYTVRVLDEANLVRDEAFPVALRLREREKQFPNEGAVFSVGLLEADDLPTTISSSVLWSRHQHIFTSVNWQENRERYYRYLYYMDLDADWLENSIMNGDFVSMIALFGWGRHSDRLSVDAKSLTVAEVREEANRFREYCDRFDYIEAANPRIAYLLVSKDSTNQFENFDRWYLRDQGETIGVYVLYRVKLRSPK